MTQVGTIRFFELFGTGRTQAEIKLFTIQATRNIRVAFLLLSRCLASRLFATDKSSSRLGGEADAWPADFSQQINLPADSAAKPMPGRQTFRNRLNLPADSAQGRIFRPTRRKAESSGRLGGEADICPADKQISRPDPGGTLRRRY